MLNNNDMLLSLTLSKLEDHDDDDLAAILRRSNRTAGGAVVMTKIKARMNNTYRTVRTALILYSII